ncbi:MAG: transglutaminase family protein [Sedimenticolaceae bacterium]
MHFAIRHHTRYRYSQPVQLGPQQLRFHPRDDGAQRVLEHHLTIHPQPQGFNEHIDLENNRVTEVWFTQKTDCLDIDVSMRVETLRQNAFDFILAQEAMTLPMAATSDRIPARAYLERATVDDTVDTFAAELSAAAQHDTLRFLDGLNHRLFAEFSHIYRDTGAPQSPAFTLQSRNGACRDLTVLFVDCCRAEGIPARFASGYQRGDLQLERRHLHAWPEVYLPGAGWRGFDPTHGQAIANTHVTVAAAADAHDTMPVSGAFQGAGATSTLDYGVEIDVTED